MKEGQDEAVISVGYHLSHFTWDKNKVRTGPAALSDLFLGAAEWGSRHTALSPHTPLPCTHCTHKGCSFGMWGGWGQIQESP